MINKQLVNHTEVNAVIARTHKNLDLKQKIMVREMKTLKITLSHTLKQDLKLYVKPPKIGQRLT